MEPTSIIVARTKKQAMEWSLVLASQGIETTIQEVAETGSFQLVIPGKDATRAFENLRLYRKENRKVHWEQAVPGTLLFFHWGILGWTLWMLLAFYLINPTPYITTGRMEGAAVYEGQWWRLFTAVSLHADEAHLAANVVIGSLLFGLAMAQYGAGTALLAGLLSGAAGNLSALMIHGETHASLGA